MGPFQRSTRHVFLAATPLALVLLASSALAAWNPAGEPVPVASCALDLNFAACDDGARGLFAFWSTSSDPRTLFGQRRLADGSLAPGWSVGGNPLTQVPGLAGQFDALADGDGGAWVVGHTPFFGPPTAQVRVWRVTGDGTLAPGWPAAGVVLGDSTSPKNVMLAGDGEGGLLVGWVELVKFEFRNFGSTLYSLNAVRLTRLDGSGALLSGWSASGNPVFEPDPDGLLAIRRIPTTMVADGTGGAWICHADSSDGLLDSRLFRMTPAGALAPGFPSDGVLVGVAGDEQAIRSIAGDGAGGVFTIGTRGHALAELETRLAHFQPSGLPASGWTSSGMAVLPGVSGTRDVATVIADGSAGVVVAHAFDDATTFQTSFRLQRYDGSGAIVAGWPADGVSIDATLGTLRGAYGEIHPDGSGGAFFVGRKAIGTDPFPSRSELLVTRIAGDGAFPAGWSAQPALVDTVNDLESIALPDHEGALFAVHTTPKDGNACPVLARRFGPDGSSTANVEDPRPARGALHAYPNPMRSSGTLQMSLPAPGPFTVEVLDAAGRRVRTLTRTATGAGDRRLDWDGRDERGRIAPPGVYLFRVQGAGTHLSERFVRVL